MKKTFMLFSIGGFLSLTGMKIAGQEPAWLWAKSAGSISYDYAQSVALDSSGNCYVTGYFNMGITFGSDSYISAGSGDIFIVKCDPDGNLMWTDAYGGTDADIPNSISVDRSGNFFIGGYFKSPTLAFDTTTLTNAGGNTFDMFVVKFDPSGKVLWAKGTGGTKDDRIYGVAVDTSGNCYATGYFASTSLTFGSTTLINSGGLDMFIVKYDPDGSIVWAKSATGSGFEYANSISVDKKSNSYITGSFNGNSITFGSTVLNKVANKDIFIVKYRSDGSVKWAKNAGVNSDNSGSCVTVDTSGNSFVTGYFKSTNIIFGSTTLTNSGNSDIFVVKYDSLGSPLWAKSAGGSLEDAGSSIATDKFGYCYLSGYFKSTSINFGTTTLTNSVTSTSDIFVTEYNPDGNIVWSKSAGNTGDDFPNSIAADTLRNFYITGSFSSPTITFDTTTMNLAGTVDIFLVKSDNTIITKVKDLVQSLDILLFPNPAEDYIKIEVPVKSVTEIYNLSGQIIMAFRNDNNEMTIDLRNLSNGVYIIKVKTERGIIAKKFIKQ